MADDKKADGASEHINLKVLGQDGSVVHFKIKKNTPLRKLMSAYCDRTSVRMEQMRFRFDGQAISEIETPAQLEMEDGDTIDVFHQQTGGCLWSHKLGLSGGWALQPTQRPISVICL